MLRHAAVGRGCVKTIWRSSFLGRHPAFGSFNCLFMYRTPTLSAYGQENIGRFPLEISGVEFSHSLGQKRKSPSMAVHAVREERSVAMVVMQKVLQRLYLLLPVATCHGGIDRGDYYETTKHDVCCTNTWACRLVSASKGSMPAMVVTEVRKIARKRSRTA